MSKTYDPRNIEHNPDGDNSYPLPDHLKHLKNTPGISGVKIGNSVFVQGAGFSNHILNELFRRIRNQESVVITITGSPGTGKTYFGKRLAQILDNGFHVTDLPELPPKEDHGQLAFTRAHLAHLVSAESPLKRGDVIMLDEAHFGIGARDWQNRDQKDLVNLLSAVRSRGFILILVVLHNSMIDKIIRDFVVNYECHMKARGTAVVYRRWFPQFSTKAHSKRLGKMKLTLPEEGLCNFLTCLGCTHLHASEDTRCETIRAIYERRKADFLDQASNTVEENGELDKPKRTPDEITELIHTNKDGLYLHKGRLAIACVEKILEENGEYSGSTKVYQARNRFEDNHPEIITALASR